MTNKTPQAEASAAEADTTTKAPDAGQTEEAAYTPPATKADLDALIAERVAQFADYDELKGKAAKFDEAENANKSELQRAQEAAAEASKRAEAAEARVLRADVAADKGVPAALLSGSTKAELEASADALLKFKGTAPKAAPPSGSGGPIHQAPGKTGDWLRDSLSAR
ncbi:MAG: hypothetical protein Q4F65_01045 [Propionibacteriaceae bacterium]|nr:hypothetical protein [Propionibacteriaceae bacterium]